MRSVIIAGASAKLISSLQQLFNQVGVPIASVCRCASEVILAQDEYESAVLVCGPLKDMPSIYIAKTLPSQWDMLILLSSSEPFPYYMSNVVPINMPINKREFFETLVEVSRVQTSSFGTKTNSKSNRSDEDKNTIETAKRKIMQNRGMSEGDAHKYLQRYSMNIGVSMSEVALRIISENEAM